MKIQRFDATSARVLRDEINAALAAVGTKLGISLTSGHIGYSADKATVTLDAKVLDVTGAALADQNLWKTYCGWYGLQPTDLGRTFMSQGILYKITGCKPNAPRFPITGERVHDGKGFKFPAATVTAGLRPAAAKAA